MSKRAKDMLIAAVAVVVLISVAIALLLTIPVDEDDTVYYTLFDATESSLSTIYITTPGNDTYSLSKASDGTNTISSFEDELVDDGRINTLFTNFESMVVTTLVDENPMDISIYGLDNPNSEVTLESSDGTTYTFLIGDSLLVDTEYYILDVDTGAVYTILASYVTGLMEEYYWFFYKTIISTTETPTRIEVSGYGVEDDFILSALDPEFVDAIGNTFKYEIVSPTERCAGTNIYSTYFASINTLDAYEVLFLEASDEVMENSGLTDPYYCIKITFGSEIYTLNISEEQDGYYLVNVSGNSKIYAVTVDSLPCVGMQYSDVVSKTAMIPEITELSSFTISGDGYETQTFLISGDTEDELYITCGDTVVDYTNIKNLYRTIGVTTGETYYDEAIEGDSYAEITYTYDDGTEYVIKFVEYDIRTLGFWFDGDAYYTLSKTYVDKILEDAQIVATNNATTLPW